MDTSRLSFISMREISPVNNDCEIDDVPDVVQVAFPSDDEASCNDVHDHFTRVEKLEQ